MPSALVQEQMEQTLDLSASTVAGLLFSSPVSSGNSVLIVMTQGSGNGSTTGNVVTASDSGTGAYTKLVDRTDAFNRALILYKTNLSSAGFSSVTFTASTASVFKVSMCEVSGLSSVIAPQAGSNQTNSSVIVLSSQALSGTGYAIGGGVFGNDISLTNFETGYNSTTESTVAGSKFHLHVRNSSGSHVWSNTQSTGTMVAARNYASALAIFSEVASGAVGRRPAMRSFFGVGR
jgi:hypothetical protein